MTSLAIAFGAGFVTGAVLVLHKLSWSVKLGKHGRFSRRGR